MIYLMRVKPTPPEAGTGVRVAIFQAERPEVKLRWHLHGQKPGLDSINIPPRAKIATLSG